MDGFYPYHEMNAYLGLTALALAAIGAAAYRDRWVAFWVVLAGLGGLLMLGKFTFLFDCANKCPFSGVRASRCGSTSGSRWRSRRWRPSGWTAGAGVPGATEDGGLARRRRWCSARSRSCFTCTRRSSTTRALARSRITWSGSAGWGAS